MRRRTLYALRYHLQQVQGFNTRLREEANLDFFCNLAKTHEFQYTPPWGGELNYLNLLQFLLWFQYTPPWGGEPTRQPYFLFSTYSFQYTPPWGGELYAYKIKDINYMFQYTPPWGGEHLLFCRNYKIIGSFNTRLREEANSATSSIADFKFVFQYTPPWGGEHNKPPYWVIQLNKFQYTPPWGGELVYSCYCFFKIWVSIHASVRRRTEKFSTLVYSPKFQYTPPWGGELPKIEVSKEIYSF